MQPILAKKPRKSADKLELNINVLYTDSQEVNRYEIYRFIM